MGLMLFRHLSLLPRLLLRLLGHAQTHDHWARVTCHVSRPHEWGES